VLKPKAFKSVLLTIAAITRFVYFAFLFSAFQASNNVACVEFGQEGGSWVLPATVVLLLHELFYVLTLIGLAAVALNFYDTYTQTHNNALAQLRRLSFHTDRTFAMFIALDVLLVVLLLGISFSLFWMAGADARATARAVLVITATVCLGEAAALLHYGLAFATASSPSARTRRPPSGELPVAEGTQQEEQQPPTPPTPPSRLRERQAHAARGPSLQGGLFPGLFSPALLEAARDSPPRKVVALSKAGSFLLASVGLLLAVIAVPGVLRRPVSAMVLYSVALPLVELVGTMAVVDTMTEAHRVLYRTVAANKRMRLQDRIDELRDEIERAKAPHTEESEPLPGDPRAEAKEEELEGLEGELQELYRQLQRLRHSCASSGEYRSSTGSAGWRGSTETARAAALASGNRGSIDIVSRDGRRQSSSVAEEESKGEAHGALASPTRGSGTLDGALGLTHHVSRALGTTGGTRFVLLGLSMQPPLEDPNASWDA